jgi:hypothetical protein
MGCRLGILVFLLALMGPAANAQFREKLPLFDAMQAVPAPAPAQPGQIQPTPEQTAPAQAAPMPAKLNINVIEGAGAVNNVRTRAPHELTVEVDDENDHPVPGAVVTFVAPSEGPGGAFTGDSQLLTVIADKDGRAVASGYRPNGAVGDYKIQVTATYNDQTATASISQSNQSQVLAKSRTGRKIAILVAVAVAVAVGAGAGLAGHGSSSSSGSASSTTTTATLGLGSGVTVGAPH